MGYPVSIRHRAGGRLRLQMTERQHSTEKWEELVRQVQELSSPQQVRGNFLTQSLVLEATEADGLERALQKVRDTGLLELSEDWNRSAPEVKLWGYQIASWKESTERFLYDVSNGQLDLRSTLGLGMLALGVRQTLTAKFLPAGLTLLMYGATFLDRPSPRKDS